MHRKLGEEEPVCPFFLFDSPDNQTCYARCAVSVVMHVGSILSAVRNTCPGTPFRPPMEPTKWAALTLCLQRSQVDVAEAMREKDEQTKRAARARADVSTYRAIVEASGSELMQQTMALQDTIRVHESTIDALVSVLDAERDYIQKQTETNQSLLITNNQLQAAVKHVQQQSDLHLELYVKELRTRTDLQRSERRANMYLERARKSRNKAQRRLYALRAQVRKADNRNARTIAQLEQEINDLKKPRKVRKQHKVRKLSRGRQILVNMLIKRKRY